MYFTKEKIGDREKMTMKMSKNIFISKLIVKGKSYTVSLLKNLMLIECSP